MKTIDKLPDSLLCLIGEYGMARSDGCNDIEIQRRWMALINGIKQYAITKSKE